MGLVVYLRKRFPLKVRTNECEVAVKENPEEIEKKDAMINGYGLLDYLEEYDKGNVKVEKDLTVELMEGIARFRKETDSLDYIRNEIEAVMETDGGEQKMMKGFANTLKGGKKEMGN